MDTFQDLIDPLIACDGIVFASPLYFMNVPARGKAFIDRCQIFWSARNLLGMKLFGNKSRFGLLISCGGRSYGPEKASLFRGIEDTMNYFFYALGLEKKESILVKKVDSKGAISELEGTLKKAHTRGRKLVQSMNTSKFD